MWRRTSNELSMDRRSNLRHFWLTQYSPAHHIRTVGLAGCYPIMFIGDEASGNQCWNKVIFQLSDWAFAVFPDLDVWRSGTVGSNGHRSSIICRSFLAILDMFGIEKIMLVAQGGASSLALSLAAMHADRVSALVLLEPQIGGSIGGHRGRQLDVPTAVCGGPSALSAHARLAQYAQGVIACGVTCKSGEKLAEDKPDLVVKIIINMMDNS